VKVEGKGHSAADSTPSRLLASPMAALKFPLPLPNVLQARVSLRGHGPWRLVVFSPWAVFLRFDGPSMKTDALGLFKAPETSRPPS